jgi:uncharacterized protein
MVSFPVYASPAMQIQPPPLREGFPQIDSLRFAEAGNVLRGRCKVAGLGRLQDMLESNAGELGYELEGARDDVGRPAIRVRIAGELQLTCQRCLKALAFPLRVDEMLVLAKSEAEIEAQPVDPDIPDRILADREMEVGTLVEDEILLAIPFAPRHEHCSGSGAEEGGQKASPFANLRGLLDRGGRAEN